MHIPIWLVAECCNQDMLVCCYTCTGSPAINLNCVNSKDREERKKCQIGYPESLIQKVLHLMSVYKERMAVIELDISFDPWLQTSELLPMSQVCSAIQVELASCTLMAVILW